MSQTNSDLEKALQALTPAAPALDRDRLMFLAGQAGARRAGLGWKLTSGLFAAASVLLAVLLVLRPPQEFRVVVQLSPFPKDSPAEKLQEDPPSADPVPVRAPESRDLAVYHLRQQIMRFGVESLPAPSDPGAPTNEPPLTIDRGKMSPTASPMNLFPWQ